MPTSREVSMITVNQTTPSFGAECDRLMRADYGISIVEAGLSIDEFVERFGDAGTPDDAVQEYAAKYDLDPLV